MPRSVPVPNAMTEPARPVPTGSGEESSLRGTGRHPVPLDAPDVALQGQRLLAYGEREVARGSRETNARAPCSRWER